MCFFAWRCEIVSPFKTIQLILFITWWILHCIIYRRKEVKGIRKIQELPLSVEKDSVRSNKQINKINPSFLYFLQHLWLGSLGLLWFDNSPFLLKWMLYYSQIYLCVYWGPANNFFPGCDGNSCLGNLEYWLIFWRWKDCHACIDFTVLESQGNSFFVSLNYWIA